MAHPDPTARRRDVGWWRPLQSRKWHFFGFDGRSYCGKWMHMGAQLETGNDDSPENCTTCHRMLVTVKTPKT